MKESLFDFFDHEDDYADLDADGAVSRLSRAIQFQTNSDCPDPTPFWQLHEHIKTSFPHVMEYGSFEALDRSILITLPGADKSLRPALFMSHLDVVPVVEGTENDWTHGAYSGDVADGYIWGRGTQDIKQQVFACLEAQEYLLSHGKTPARTVYLAFGQDEETFNQGALSISNLLKSRGVTLEFLLDEGGGKIEQAGIFGAPDTYVSTISIMEKGYADLKLVTRSSGGHSSRPFGGTSLGNLSEAIAAVTKNPFPVKMSPVLAKTFETLKPYITEEPLKSLVAAGDQQAIADYCMGNKDLFPFVTTTIAPTMIKGGSGAPNVMPQTMEAIINFRLNTTETPDIVMEHCRKVIASDKVELSFQQSNSASNIARTDGLGYEKLIEAMSRYYKDVVFVPTLSVGATDAHQYEQICDTCLRFGPFMTPLDDDGTTGAHGTDEKLLVRVYIQGIKAIIHFMELTTL